MINYGKLKNKFKNYVREDAVKEVMFSDVASMFKWKTNTIYNDNMIEPLLLVDGKCAIIDRGGDNPDDRFILGYGSFGGNLDYNGVGKNFIFTSLNGRFTKEFKDWKNNKKIALFFNNWQLNQDLNIPRYANMLAEIDKSIEIAIANTRLSLIIQCADDNTRKAYELAIEKAKEGQPTAITSANLFDDSENGKVVELLVPERVSTIQYLSMLRNELTSRLLNMYGINNPNTLKKAQQTADEFEIGAEYCQVLPNVRFECRQEMLKICNEKFGTNWTVEKNELLEINVDGVSPEDENNDDKEVNNDGNIDKGTESN